MNAPDPQFAARVRESFGRQKAMALIGASLTSVRAGEVEIALPWREDLTQQKGFVHGGILGMIADTACGYAAFSLMPASAAVLTVEFKTNFVAPAAGEHFRFEGTVVKPGRTITFCEAAAIARSGNADRLVATMSGTLMAVDERGNIRG